MRAMKYNLKCFVLHYHLLIMYYKRMRLKTQIYSIPMLLLLLYVKFLRY